MTNMEDNQNGRQTKCRTTKMKHDQNGRRQSYLVKITRRTALYELTRDFLLHFLKMIRNYKNFLFSATAIHHGG